MYFRSSSTSSGVLTKEEYSSMIKQRDEYLTKENIYSIYRDILIYPNECKFKHNLEKMYKNITRFVKGINKYDHLRLVAVVVPVCGAIACHCRIVCLCTGSSSLHPRQVLGERGSTGRVGCAPFLSRKRGAFGAAPPPKHFHAPAVPARQPQCHETHRGPPAPIPPRNARGRPRRRDVSSGSWQLGAAERGLRRVFTGGSQQAAGHLQLTCS
jgi:hypothetical protein